MTSASLTIYGKVEAVRRLAELIEAIPGLMVERSSDVMTVADGSGRVRLYLAVLL